MNDLYTKALVAGAIQTFFIAFLISYYKVDVPRPHLGFIGDFIRQQSINLGLWDPNRRAATKSNGKAKKADEKHQHIGAKKKAKKKVKVDDDGGEADDRALRVLTKEELAEYDGQKGSKGLYLALLGQVFDVESGRKHYGPGGGYSFFTGRDATRAFVSGDFTEKGLIDDVDGLGEQDMLGIEEWLAFYAKDYKFVGYLEGTYYDAHGKPTAAKRKADQLTSKAHQWKQKLAKENERFPSCNSEWKQHGGARVWCTKKSGGVARDWVGVPRKLFKPGSADSRCACVRDSGPPSDAKSGAKHNNRGDLDNPNLKLYADCEPTAEACKVPS